jgi:membrane protein
VVGSIGYAVYVETIADYSNLYGSLGAVIGFLIWLWLSNMAMLYGVELNARLERTEPG